MTGLHMLLTLFIAWSLVVVVKPRVVWYLSAWQYRNPEKNEPSDVMFLFYRLGAAILLIASLWVWGDTWQSGPDSSEAASDAERSSRPERPSWSMEEIPATSTNGQILGYITDDPQTLAVYTELGACMFRVGSGADAARRVREDDETITIAVSYPKSDIHCGSEPDHPVRSEVGLSAPVGEREVVDTDGNPIPRCEQACS